MCSSNGHTTKIMINGLWKEKDKIAYPSLDIAIEYARKINMRKDTIRKVVAYKCSVCGQYHIGRSYKSLTEKEREKYKKAKMKLNMF